MASTGTLWFPFLNALESMVSPAQLALVTVPGFFTGELKEASDELARVKEALEGSEAASAKAVEKAEVRW